MQNASPIILMVVLLAIMYFMMIRPQKKREKLTKEMHAGLIKGDKIVTIGGVIGKIVSIKDDEIVIETGSASEKGYIKFQRESVREVLKPAPSDKYESFDDPQPETENDESQENK